MFRLVPTPQPVDSRSFRTTERNPISRRKTRAFLIEVGLWALAVALLSPLVVYAGRPNMPIVALYGVAAGIAMAIALAGRQLHDVLLADGLTRHKGVGKLFLAAGMMLLVILLVLLGVVVALLLLFRKAGVSPVGVGAGLGA
jgi:hypothetical protein